MQHPWEEDQKCDHGSERSTSNRRCLVHNPRKQTSPQSKATQPVGAPGIGTCSKTPHALRRCAELLGTWQRIKRPPSSWRKQRKSSRSKPMAIPRGSATAGCAKRYFERAKDPSSLAQNKCKFPHSQMI